jgi:hypothetical protein
LRRTRIFVPRTSAFVRSSLAFVRLTNHSRQE